MSKIFLGKIKGQGNPFIFRILNLTSESYQVLYRSVVRPSIVINNHKKGNIMLIMNLSNRIRYKNKKS